MSTIKISKESMERFNHDKNVVGATNRVPCPINNGADLNSDAMLDNLFEFDDYVERQFGNHFVALGFIEDVPFKVEYDLFDNRLLLSCYDYVEGKRKFNILSEEIEKRLTDEQVKPDLVFYADVDGKEYFGICDFYYDDKYAEQYLL